MYFENLKIHIKLLHLQHVNLQSIWIRALQFSNTSHVKKKTNSTWCRHQSLAEALNNHTTQWAHPSRRQVAGDDKTQERKLAFQAHCTGHVRLPVPLGLTIHSCKDPFHQNDWLLWGQHDPTVWKSLASRSQPSVVGPAAPISNPAPSPTGGCFCDRGRPSLLFSWRIFLADPNRLFRSFLSHYLEIRIWGPGPPPDSSFDFVTTATGYPALALVLQFALMRLVRLFLVQSWAAQNFREKEENSIHLSLVGFASNLVPFGVCGVGRNFIERWVSCEQLIIFRCFSIYFPPFD